MLLKYILLLHLFSNIYNNTISSYSNILSKRKLDDNDNILTRWKKINFKTRVDIIYIADGAIRQFETFNFPFDEFKMRPLHVPPMPFKDSIKEFYNNPTTLIDYLETSYDFFNLIYPFLSNYKEMNMNNVDKMENIELFEKMIETQHKLIEYVLIYLNYHNIDLLIVINQYKICLHYIEKTDVSLFNTKQRFESLLVPLDSAFIKKYLEVNHEMKENFFYDYSLDNDNTNIITNTIASTSASFNSIIKFNKNRVNPFKKVTKSSKSLFMYKNNNNNNKIDNKPIDFDSIHNRLNILNRWRTIPYKTQDFILIGIKISYDLYLEEVGGKKKNEKSDKKMDIELYKLILRHKMINENHNFYLNLKDIEWFDSKGFLLYLDEIILILDTTKEVIQLKNKLYLMKSIQSIKQLLLFLISYLEGNHSKVDDISKFCDITFNHLLSAAKIVYKDEEIKKNDINKINDKKGKKKFYVDNDPLDDEFLMKSNQIKDLEDIYHFSCSLNPIQQSKSNDNKNTNKDHDKISFIDFINFIHDKYHNNNNNYNNNSNDIVDMEID